MDDRLYGGLYCTYENDNYSGFILAGVDALPGVSSVGPISLSLVTFQVMVVFFNAQFLLGKWS